MLRAREAIMISFRPILAKHGFTEQQWRVLRVLGEKGPSDAGQVAFDACIKYFINYYNLKTKYKFKHDAIFKIGNFYLVGCYHPSPRNVNTKRINQPKMVKLFLKAQKLMKHNLSK